MSDQPHRNQPLETVNADAPSYWQGTQPESVESYPESGVSETTYGSMSAAARRSYANEAIRQKDHVAAGLLAIFLGMFGVHKFYLGCNNAGFIMLAVSIIGGIVTIGLAAAVIWLIAIIEGIIYLARSQTDFERLYVLNRRDWF